MQFDRKITISAGSSRRAMVWQAQTLLISELWAKLQTPARGTEPLAEYLNMKKAQQDDLKDVGGFMAGTLSGPRRKANNVTGRDVITLDLDNIPPGGTEDVLRRVEGLSCGYCIYSTRKHSPAAPRLRVLLPLDRTASADEYAFNTLCCPATESTVVNLYVKYTQRMRDEVGAKFQLVAWKPSADYEGVIGVWNTATHATIANVDTQAVVYWTTGAHAGVAVNKSLTNAKYDGELILDTEYTQAALEAALKAGKFMFHNVNGVTRVLEDINTLLTLSDTKGEVFQSNQTIRVCDQIANDTAVLFNTRYVGTVPNDASGRASLWGDVVKLIQELEKIRAVENFDPDTVTCEQGDKKKAVLLTINGLNIINAMAQLYMSVIIQ